LISLLPVEDDNVEDENEEEEDDSPPVERTEHTEHTKVAKHRRKRSAASAEKPRRSLADLVAAKSRAAAKKATPLTIKANKITAHAPAVETEIKNTMIQVASVRSKAAAEAEYRRILNKNKFLRGLGKKFVKVDLGEKKGVRYNIQIGPFRGKSEAKKIISELKNNGFSPYIAK
jgi:cell division protein FtsN